MTFDDPYAPNGNGGSSGSNGAAPPPPPAPPAGNQPRMESHRPEADDGWALVVGPGAAGSTQPAPSTPAPPQPLSEQPPTPPPTPSQPAPSQPAPSQPWPAQAAASRVTAQPAAQPGKSGRNRMIGFGALAVVALLLIGTGLGYLFSHGDNVQANNQQTEPKAQAPNQDDGSDQGAGSIQDPDSGQDQGSGIDDSDGDSDAGGDISTDLADEIQQQVNNKLDQCMETTAAEPAGCPQRMTAGDWLGQEQSKSYIQKRGLNEVDSWELTEYPSYGTPVRNSSASISLPTTSGMSGRADYPNTNQQDDYNSYHDFTCTFTAVLRMDGDTVSSISFVDTRTVFE